MGWTGVHKEKGEKTVDFLLKQYGPEFAANVEASHQSGSTVFFRVRVSDEKIGDRIIQDKLLPREDGSYAYIMVVLTERDKGYFNFRYKDMDEFAGPYEANVPLAFVEKASELAKSGAGYAEGFRNRVKLNANKDKFMVPGTKLEFGKPIMYGGKEVERVTVVKEKFNKNYVTVFYNPNHGYLRPPKNLMDYHPSIVA